MPATVAVTRFWAEPEDPNPATALAGYVGSGAPLIAGFELAAIILLLTSPGIARAVPLAGPAVLAMVSSALLLVFSIRYGFWAVSYWTTPDERIMWHPAALADDTELERERRKIAGRMAYFRVLRNRAEHLFQLGIMVFLVAIVLALIPDHWHADGTGWRWAAALTTVAALAVHVLWTVGLWLHEHIPGWIRACGRKPSASGHGWAGLATFLTRLDVRLVRYLAVIWPPARAPRGVQPPGDPSAADLRGLRRQ